MDFIYNFEIELVEEIIRHAMKKGYNIQITEWIDEWEREEGCPSISRLISSEKYYKEYEGREYYLLPKSNKYGCSELNFIKGSEYVCFYHTELNDTYICEEALDLINLDELEIWINEDILEKISEESVKYLHGECHEWVKNHFKEGDKALVSLRII